MRRLQVSPGTATKDATTDPETTTTTSAGAIGSLLVLVGGITASEFGAGLDADQKHSMGGGNISTTLGDAIAAASNASQFYARGSRALSLNAESEGIPVRGIV